MASISVQAADFDLGKEVDLLKADTTSIGAVVTFTGTVRDVGGTLSSMTLEHYPGMTERELGRIASEAESRWALLGCRVIHRHGTLKPGDNIVLVITASAHRTDAFKAAEFLMDFLKSEAPFWKKERTADHDSWVEAKVADTAALRKWDQD
ncbi:MAG: molybdenum cofactor biosynthesis protein MoaE [Kordiimonadaceae bacterium]|nr:molybdenum cofactor biosynthesis protein MoaE [Kordiimonadaceae bacterium]